MKDAIRNKLIETIRKIIVENPKGSTQINTLIEATKPLIPKDTPPFQFVEYNKFVFEIVNEWYLAGILYFGMPDNPNSGHPFITITEFGRKCINSGNFLPYDPEGYVRELQKQVRSIDDLTLTYLRESITTYNRELLLSATITLGVASENLILLLIDAFTNSMANSQDQAAFTKTITDKSIYTKYNLFLTELKKYAKKIPSNLIKDFEPQLDGIFNFIRITRNQAGHPTGQAPNKKVIGSNLQIFAEYSKKVFDFINYFNTNKI